MYKVGFWALAAFAGLLLLVLFNLFQPAAPVRRTTAAVPYSTVLAEVAAGQVESVAIQGRTLSGRTRDGRTFQAYLPDDPGLARRLAEAGIRVEAMPDAGNDADPLLHLAVTWLPFLLYLVVFSWPLTRIAAELRGLRRAMERTAEGNR